jgi:hypothetical protein
MAIALCVVPVLAHGQETLTWSNPKYWEPDKMVRGSIYLEAGTAIGEDYKTSKSGYWDFVGVKDANDLWDAGYSAWAVGPDMVTKILHPDPNVSPAIKDWMRKNKVNFAVTSIREGEYYFWGTRYNHTDSFDTDEYRNRNDAYSTLYYDGTR